MDLHYARRFQRHVLREIKQTCDLSLSWLLSWLEASLSGSLSSDLQTVSESWQAQEHPWCGRVGGGGCE